MIASASHLEEIYVNLLPGRHLVDVEKWSKYYGSGLKQLRLRTIKLQTNRLRRELHDN
jgi:hypothetical protein